MINTLFHGGRGRLIGGLIGGILLAFTGSVSAADEELDHLVRYLDRFERSAWASDDDAVAAIDQRLRARLVEALARADSPSPSGAERLWTVYDRAVRRSINDAEAVVLAAGNDLRLARQGAAPDANRSATERSLLTKLEEAQRGAVARELAQIRERVWVADRLRDVGGRTDVHLALWQRCWDHKARDVLASDFEDFLGSESTDLGPLLVQRSAFLDLLTRIFASGSPNSDTDPWRERLAQRLSSLGPLAELGLPSEVERSIRTARARELLQELGTIEKLNLLSERAASLSRILAVEAGLDSNGATERAALLVEHGLCHLQIESMDWTKVVELPGEKVQRAGIVGAELWPDERDVEGPQALRTPDGVRPVEVDWWLLEGQRYRLTIEAELERGGATRRVQWKLLVKIESSTQLRRVISIPRFLPSGTRPIADAIQPSRPGILLTDRLTELDWVTGFGRWLEKQLSVNSFRGPVDNLIASLVSQGSPALQEALAGLKSGAPLAELQSALRRASSVAAAKPWSFLPEPEATTLIAEILKEVPAGSLESRHLRALDSSIGAHLDVEAFGDPYEVAQEGRLWFDRRRYDRADAERPLVIRLVVE